MGFIWPCFFDESCGAHCNYTPTVAAILNVDTVEELQSSTPQVDPSTPLSAIEMTPACRPRINYRGKQRRTWVSFLLVRLHTHFFKPHASDWQATGVALCLSHKHFAESPRQHYPSHPAVDCPLNLERWEARGRDTIDDKGKYPPESLLYTPP